MSIPSHNPLISLPHKTEYILFLLREELKANCFFRGLAQVCLEDTFYQPYLGSLILQLMGFDARQEDLMNWYVTHLDRFTQKIKPNSKTLMKQTLNFYLELKLEKKRRRGK